MARLFLLLARQAAVPKPRALAAPFVAAASLALLLVPLWPFGPPGARPIAVALPELVLVVTGLAAGVILDRLAERLRPVPAERQAHRPSAGTARRRPLAGAATVRLRVAWRRLRARVPDMLPRPQAGAAATVLVLAAMLVLEAWTHAQPLVAADPEPAPTHESSP